MGKARVGGGCEGDGAERRRVGRLIRNLRVYSQRFVERHGLEAVAISIKVHEGRVVRVSHTYTTHFPVLAARGGNCCVSPEAHDAARPRSRRANLTPEELNRRIRQRMHRLIRPFGIRFGALDINVARGSIATILPAPPFRPNELKRFEDLGGDQGDGEDNAEREDRRVA